MTDEEQHRHQFLLGYVLTRVEAQCRYQDEIVVQEHGFGDMTQEKYLAGCVEKAVLKSLSSLGYTCNIKFYDDQTSCIRISGWS